MLGSNWQNRITWTKVRSGKKLPCHVCYGCKLRLLILKLSEVKPDKICLSSCLVNAKPKCPYPSAEEFATILKNKTGIEVVQGTHGYHQSGQ